MRITSTGMNIKVSRSVKKLGLNTVSNLSEALSSKEIKEVGQNKTIKIKRGGIANLMLMIEAKEKLSLKNIFKKRYSGRILSVADNSKDLKEEIIKAISNIKKTTEDAIQRKTKQQKEQQAISKAFKNLNK